MIVTEIRAVVSVSVTTKSPMMSLTSTTVNDKYACRHVADATHGPFGVLTEGLLQQIAGAGAERSRQGANTS